MTTIQEAALAFHTERRTSAAMVTVHMSGFHAGAEGKAASSSPWWKDSAQDGSIHAHEWQQAWEAGRAHVQAPKEMTLF